MSIGPNGSTDSPIEPHLERTSKKDWGIWEYIPYIGDAIMAGEWLGEWGNELGRESRASRAAAFDIALSED